MPNFPKPPKLYYYLAGLVVFVLILGGVGFYFYQKENLLVSYSNSIQDNTTKSEKIEDQKPFVSDKYSDVIVWKECDLAIRTKKLHPDSTVYKYFQNSKINDKLKETAEEFREDFLIINFSVTKISFLASCYPKKYDKNVTKESLKTFGKLSNIANPISQLASQLSFFTDQKKIDVNYSYNVKNYTPDSDQGNLIQGYQIDSLLPSAASREIIDLNLIKDIVSINDTEFKDKLAPTTSISSNCNNDSNKLDPLNSFGCLLFDQNGMPIYNLTNSSNKAQEIYKNSEYDETKGRTKEYLSGLFGSTEYGPTYGKITSEGQYLRYTYGDSCGSSVYIYEFSFKERKLLEIDGGSYTGCAGLDISGDEMIVNTDCFSKPENMGQKAKSCFKNTKDFDKYIKEYNEEQAKNDQTRARLAKYLE
jgi:hypothetical protein